MRIPFGIILALLFVALWKLRIILYKFKTKKRLFTPVLSIGNLTMGGTGKTPMVDYILTQLQRRNPELRLGVLSRGYKSGVEKPQRVGESDVFAGDEIEWLKARHPQVDMAVYKKRYEAGRLLETTQEYGLFILDDGFQHWDLHRDFDLVLIDATQGAEALAFFPIGQAREPLIALRRAKLIVLTKVNWAEPAKLQHLLKILPIYAPHTPIYEFESLLETPNFDVSAKIPIVLMSGIARPQVFENALREKSISIMHHFKFSDHYNYTEEDCNRVMEYCRQHQIREVWTTEKDEVKLSKLWDSSTNIQLKTVTMRFKPKKDEEGFYEKVAQIFS